MNLKGPVSERAIKSAAASLSRKNFTAVKKQREVGGTAANNPLPGDLEENLVRRDTGENAAAAQPLDGRGGDMRAESR